MSVDERMMKLGKKYLFKNGSTTWENGYKSGDYHSVEELNGYLESVQVARLIEN